MLFVEKTGSTDPAHRYKVGLRSPQWVALTNWNPSTQILGKWFVPMSTHDQVKRVAPVHFVITVHKPAILAELHLIRSSRAYNILPSGVETRFSLAREARGSHPPLPHRNCQLYQRDGVVGLGCMVEPPSPIGQASK